MKAAPPAQLQGMGLVRLPFVPTRSSLMRVTMTPGRSCGRCGNPTTGGTLPAPKGVLDSPCRYPVLPVGVPIAADLRVKRRRPTLRAGPVTRQSGIPPAPARGRGSD